MSTLISNRDKVTYHEIADHYNSNKLLFGIKYFKNWILELLASNVARGEHWDAAAAGRQETCPATSQRCPSPAPRPDSLRALEGCVVSGLLIVD